MPVYNGNSKAKDLYYGGTKIKEAYYGSTKVYSSGPLYYCYKRNNVYIYLLQKPQTDGVITYYVTDFWNPIQASSSSDLTVSDSANATNVTNNQFVLGGQGYVYDYYPSRDLYT